MFKISSIFTGLGVTNIALVAIILSFSNLTNAADIWPAMITPEVGKTYYTRYNFMFERGKHATTNYWRGELVPLNTEVTLVSVGGKKMVLDMDGVRVTFVNARKHTQRGTEKIASELLSPTKIPLERLPEELREDILSGVMRLGMTKEQVLMTRGYPPRHKTSSIKANTWVYWSNKFVKRSLVFRKGKLTQGRGLY